jgi:transcriptional regulator with XRE-family HTH domain
MDPEDVWKSQLGALGSFIRTQRQLANLSLRETAKLSEVSSAYLSQVERGLHQPSLRVIRSLADALNLSAETLLAQAGLVLDEPVSDSSAPAEPGPVATVAAILADPTLSRDQKETVLSVYRALSTAERQDEEGGAPPPNNPS